MYEGVDVVLKRRDRLKPNVGIKGNIRKARPILLHNKITGERLAFTRESTLGGQSTNGVRQDRSSQAYTEMRHIPD